MTLFQQKKLYHFLEPRAAAPVATTSLGLGICTCPRPKEVVDRYSIPMVEDTPNMLLWVRVNRMSRADMNDVRGSVASELLPALAMTI